MWHRREGQSPATEPRLAFASVPAGRKGRNQPRDYLAKGRDWPEGPLKSDAPDEARCVMEIARTLKSAIKKQEAKEKQDAKEKQEAKEKQDTAEGQDTAEKQDTAEGQQSVRHRLADAANVTEKTIFNILSGRTWCEVPTIYQLEKALDTQLWPTGHVKRVHPAQWWKNQKK